MTWDWIFRRTKKRPHTFNTERLLELASDLRAETLPNVESPGGMICPHFNMRSFVFVPDKERTSLDSRYEPDWCGTTCCIAGLAVLKWDRPTLVNGFSQTVEYYSDSAQKLLGLDHRTSRQLFVLGYLSGPRARPGEISTDMVGNDKLWAARCLEKLAATGKVDWAGTEQPCQKNT